MLHIIMIGVMMEKVMYFKVCFKLYKPFKNNYC